MKHSTKTRFAASFHALCLCALALFASLGSSTQALAQGGGSTAGSSPIDETRNALSEWVKTERIIAAERAKWREGKSLLEARIELVKQRIQTLRDEIAADEGKVKESDGRKEELVARSEKLRASTEKLEAAIEAHETRIRELLKQLPAPLLDTVRPLVARLPEVAKADAADGEGEKSETSASNLGLSQRYFNVLAIMTEVNKFNTQVKLNTETRKGPKGDVEVTVLYVGLGQAYYANEKGDVAGVGVPGPGGWVWKPEDASAERIARAIAIYKNEKAAAFVPVPVEVK